MPVIKAQRVPKRKLKESDIEDSVIRFCYNFPQYTYAQANKLPYKRIRYMLKIAKQEEGRKFFHLAKIVTSQHTAKGKGMRKVVEYFKDMMEGKDK